MFQGLVSSYVSSNSPFFYFSQQNVYLKHFIGLLQNPIDSLFW